MAGPVNVSRSSPGSSLHLDDYISPSFEKKSVKLVIPTLVGADLLSKDDASITSLETSSFSDVPRIRTNLQRSVSTSDLPFTPKLPVRYLSYSPVNSENEGSRGSISQKAKKAISSVKSIVFRKSSASAGTSTSQSASAYETLTKSTSLERPTPSRRSSSSESMDVAADSASLESVPSTSSEGTVKSRISRSSSIASFAQSIFKPGKGQIKLDISGLKSKLEFDTKRVLELREKIQKLDPDAEQIGENSINESKQFREKINLIAQEKIDSEFPRLRRLANNCISKFLVESRIEELQIKLEKENKKIELPDFLKFLKVFRFLGILKIFHDKENASSLSETIENLKATKRSKLTAIKVLSEPEKPVNRTESNLSSFLEEISFSSEFYSAEFINTDGKEELQEVLSKYDLAMREEGKSSQERKIELEGLFGKWVEEKKEAFRNNLITEIKVKLNEESTSRTKNISETLEELADKVISYSGIDVKQLEQQSEQLRELMGEDLFSKVYPVVISKIMK